MRWRFGLAYYSFLREMYVLARLRELGLPMHVHPLADALFGADFWSGITVVEFLIGNRQFGTAGSGRKTKDQEILGDQGTFQFTSLEMAVQRDWGVVHLPSGCEVDQPGVRAVADIMLLGHTTPEDVLVDRSDPRPNMARDLRCDRALP
jgi:hypothetical protein